MRHTWNGVVGACVGDDLARFKTTMNLSAGRIETLFIDDFESLTLIFGGANVPHIDACPSRI
ncbi:MULTISPECIES: hypothetical protein [Nocardiaceae]|uniref:hypothetical protein n=1 Tax=Nocardiaceae TaxID=85025 RepID=UPI0011408ADF|nr:MULTISPECIES: hypothetical protein [Rhodococcus]